jgi:hypothetical protein
VQSILPAGTAGHGLPSGQIWALNFEPLWTALAANETLVVDAKKTNIVLKTNVRVALFRPVNINSPQLKIDEIVPLFQHQNAYFYTTHYQYSYYLPYKYHY